MIKFIENRGRKGYFDIKVYRKGKLFKHDIIKNIITDVALNKEIEILLGNAPDMEINYMAFGTDNTTPAPSDTTLGSESARFQPTTSFTRIGVGETIGSIFLVSSDLVGVAIKEIGVFCGSAATSTTDTGTMLSRILWSFDKTVNDEVEITRTDTVERG